VAGEVALEGACGVAAAFAFGDAAVDVGAGGGVVLAAVEDDRVEGAVELAVAAAAGPVADRLARSESGAVIRLRNCTNARRRTSTALRRASKSTRSASCCSPPRGSVQDAA
jgi:hypothetical protein